MENRNRLYDFPRYPSLFINNHLPSRVYVIRLSHFPSYLRQRRSSDMMKLQGLITMVRSLFGGHRPTFGFVVLPFVRAVLFPSYAICWSWVREHVRRGRHVECFKSRFLCYTSPPLFSLFPTSLFSFLWFLP